MKTIAYISATFFALHAFAAEIVIKIQEIKKTEGVILVALYDNADNWPAGEPFRALQVDVQTPETTVFIEVPEGTYAVSVLQDLNGNGAMDYNAIRMPKEPWGVSNDAPARFGPPKWDRMRFEVTAEGRTVELSLRN